MASRFGQSSQEMDRGSSHRGVGTLSFVCLKRSFYNQGAFALALKRGTVRPPASPGQLAELGLNPGALSLCQVSTAGQCSSGISEFPAFLGDPAQPTCPARPALPTGLAVPAAPAQPPGGTPVCAPADPAPPRPTQPRLLEQCQGGLRAPARSRCSVLGLGSSLGGLHPPFPPPSLPSVLHTSWSPSDPRAWELKATGCAGDLPHVFIKLDGISYVVRPPHFRQCLPFGRPHSDPFPSPPDGESTLPARCPLLSIILA